MSDVLIERLNEQRRAAEEAASTERVWAWSNSGAHYLFGALGVVGGAFASLGSAGVLSSTLGIVFGASAAIGSGLVTAFGFRSIAHAHDRAIVRFRTVADNAANAIARLDGQDDPPADEIYGLVNTIQQQLDVGKHVEIPAAAEADSTVLDLQVAPTSDVTTTVILACLLLLVGAYLYKTGTRLDRESAESRSILVELASLFAATPAAIGAVVAYRGTSMVRYVSKGPRLLLVLLTLIAAILALSVGLRQPPKVTEGLGYALAAYSFGVLGVFLGIRVNPRWRWNERSRRRKLTEQTTAADCRLNQGRFAWVALLIWAVLTILFARMLHDLHHANVIRARGFPINLRAIWQALSS